MARAPFFVRQSDGRYHHVPGPGAVSLAVSVSPLPETAPFSAEQLTPAWAERQRPSRPDSTAVWTEETARPGEQQVSTWPGASQPLAPDPIVYAEPEGWEHVTPIGGDTARYHDLGTIPVEHTKSTVKEVNLNDVWSRIDVPDDIKQLASSIHGRMTKYKGVVVKGKRRLQLAYVCLLYAYREQESYVDSQNLAQRSGLQGNDASQALILFSEIQTGYQPPPATADATTFLEEFCLTLGLQAQQPAIITIYRTVQHHPELSQAPPRNVAVGVISHYGTLLGWLLDQELVRLTNLTPGIIRSYGERVKRCYHEQLLSRPLY
jgi:hypothetical protein